jgi:hypothetical protein
VGSPAIEPILRCPPVEQNGRLFDPSGTDQVTGPFVIGKLAWDGVEADVVYGEDPSRPTNMTTTPEPEQIPVR